eukprot:4472169-Pyramimonas_sp.AAC.1
MMYFSPKKSCVHEDCHRSLSSIHTTGSSAKQDDNPSSSSANLIANHAAVELRRRLKAATAPGILGKRLEVRNLQSFDSAKIQCHNILYPGTPGACLVFSLTYSSVAVTPFLIAHRRTVHARRGPLMDRGPRMLALLAALDAPRLKADAFRSGTANRLAQHGGGT